MAVTTPGIASSVSFASEVLLASPGPSSSSLMSSMISTTSKSPKISLISELQGHVLILSFIHSKRLVPLLWLTNGNDSSVLQMSHSEFGVEDEPIFLFFDDGYVMSHRVTLNITFSASSMRLTESISNLVVMPLCSSWLELFL